MKEEKEDIHALFFALTTMHAVLGKTTKPKAMKKAYREIVDIYGESHLEEVFKDEIQEN